MRQTIAAFCLFTVPLFAQSSDWNVLKQLGPGQMISVERDSGISSYCQLDSVTDDALFCERPATRHYFSRFPRTLSISRQDVRQVRLASRTRGGLRGLLVGGLIGAGIGAATNRPPEITSQRVLGSITGAFLFGMFGAGAGSAFPGYGKAIYER